MKFVLAIDFDGTLFHGTWNVDGEPNVPVISQTKRFCDHPGCEVILWTCREERLLVDAISRCEGVGLQFDAINMNASETLLWNSLMFGRQGNTSGRKVFADLYVDDKSPGSIDHYLSLDPESEWDKVKDRNVQQ